MNDEIRDRLQGIDPMPPDVSVEPVAAPAARERLERIMNSPVIEQSTDPDTDHDTDQTDAVTGRTTRAARRRRQGMFVGMVAAATVVAIGAAVVVNRDGGGDVVQTAPLELSLGASDAMASCMALDVNLLADMSPAFAATAVAVEGETVTLDVDTWYSGGDADQVVLRAASGMEALIAGFDFEVGQQYLITAAEGTVNFCGYSGPATPELRAAFEQAFPG